jgi:hypothetical protein
LRLSSGLGIRIDNHGGDRAVRATGLTIDNVYVEGATNSNWIDISASGSYNVCN